MEIAGKFYGDKKVFSTKTPIPSLDITSNQGRAVRVRPSVFELKSELMGSPSFLLFFFLSFFLFQHRGDRGGAERALSLSADAQDGALGEEGLHPHSAEAAHHEEAAVPARQAHVSGQIRVVHTHS